MQSTKSKGIKAALWEQAFNGGTQVSCPMGQVGAIRKGQLLAMIRECGRWYLVEYVTIKVVFTWPVPMNADYRGTGGTKMYPELRIRAVLEDQNENCIFQRGF